MPNPIIIANWKMNCTRAESLEIARAIAGYAGNHNIVVCPPFTVLFPLVQALKNLKLGGQDCSAHEKGAHTGEISASQLKDAGCSYVILGHSERRRNLNEQSELIREKATRALNSGLIPIICVGETAEEKKLGHTLEIIGEQLLSSVPAGANPGNAIIAYEPVWSIGTGVVPKDAEVAQAAEFIVRATKNIPIIYGGSVNGDNAADLLKIKNISGLLVGGASLNPKEFWKIVNSVNVTV